MNNFLYRLIVLSIIMISCNLYSDEVNITKGQIAPDFTLLDQNGNSQPLPRTSQGRIRDVQEDVNATARFLAASSPFASSPPAAPTRDPSCNDTRALPTPSASIVLFISSFSPP